MAVQPGPRDLERTRVILGIVRVNEPGSYVMVPQGTWHTARPHAPTTMLFATPGEGTVNAETPG